MKIEIPSIEEQNRIVAEQEKMASIHIYCTKEQKAIFTNHAKKQGKKLGEWALKAMQEKQSNEE